MLYILTGTDEYSRQQALEEIKKSAGNKDELATNTTHLDGRQVSVDNLHAACETMPFLAGKRLVIIEGLLGRFEESRTDRKRAASKSETASHESIAAYLKQVPDFTIVVLIEGKIEKNPMFEELSRYAKVRVFSPLADAQLQQWVNKRVGQESGSISPQAVPLLTRLVGGNLRVMASEIDKLLIYAKGRRIEEADVTDLVADIQESTVFAMVDAILEYRPGPAQNMIERFMERGAAPPYLLSMILRQVGLIVRARDLKERGVAQGEIQGRLGMAGFAVRKTLEQAKKYPLARIKEVYDRLLEADLSIKTGRQNGDLALTVLVAELAGARLNPIGPGGAKSWKS